MLRALGRFLDDVQAFGIEVIDQGEAWTVAWDRPGSMRFQVFEIDALREVARMGRGLGGDMPRLTTSQILRVLGTVLDEQEASSFAIRETDDGYSLASTVKGKETTHTYSLDEIRELLDDLFRVR